MKSTYFFVVTAVAFVLSNGCAQKAAVPEATLPDPSVVAETKPQQQIPIPAEAAKPGIQVGERAPEFMLPNEAGQEVKLSSLLGERGVLLAFYPADFTGG